MEAAWKVATPVLDLWASLPARDFPNHPAGTWGPAAATALGALFAIAAAFFLSGGIAAHQRMAANDDPVAATDQALAASFNRDVAEREIRDALAADDVDLAQSFVDLAAERNVAIDPALPSKVNETDADRRTFANAAGRFVHGLWTGEPADFASLAGTAFGDLFVFGDIRDAAREGTRYLTGQQYDPWILGLAGVGIAITAVTYASFGATAPERVGVSLFKAARRTGRSPARSRFPAAPPCARRARLAR